MKNIIIAILVAVVLVFAFLFFTQKKSGVSYEPWPETEPATVRPTTTNNNSYPVQNNPAPVNPAPITSQPQAFSQPKLSDYPSSTPTFSHTTSFTTEPVELYEQRLGTDFLAESPNFASYYRIGTVGCGTACWSFSVVDLRDGKVYRVPEQSGNGYEAKVNSKLYAGISTPNDIDYPDPQFNAELAAKNREAKVKWYVFNESTKTFTFLRQGYCNLMEGQYPATNTVVQCIE